MDEIGYTTRCHNGRFKSGKRKGHCRPSKGHAKKRAKAHHRRGRAVPAVCRQVLSRAMTGARSSGQKRSAMLAFHDCQRQVRGGHGRITHAARLLPAYHSY